MRHAVDDFQLGDRAMRYSLFAPRLYNYCLSLGFSRSRMMPSRAFCSDESQGYPVILLMQHFGAFPFDHGRVGGKVATDRHGPHAHHGEDLVIVQASHVGYDPVRRAFGVYQRPRTADRGFGDNCGKLCAILRWYQNEVDHARQNILFGAVEDRPAVFIDNLLLTPDRAEGLFLHLDRLIASDRGGPLKILSTSKAFHAAPDLVASTPADVWRGGRTPIGDRLTADMFFFRRTPVAGPEGHDLLEASLAPAMPTLATSAHPALDAARYHTQVEFDRTYRSLQGAPEYRGKNLLFVAGLNIDVSPPEGVPFPLTKFVPWAAYSQLRDGAATLLEQDALVEALVRQPTSNPDQISFDAAILAMAEAKGVSLPL
ncbi:MAG: hypothetical protein ABSA66_04335 [Roseiarcus sp.]|jgi:hypothetical protein